MSIANLAPTGNQESTDSPIVGCIRTTDEGIVEHPQKRVSRFDVRAFLDRLDRDRKRSA